MDKMEDRWSKMVNKYGNHCFISKTCGVFAKLLFRWEGSIYKLIWPEFIGFCILYVILSVIYRFALDIDQQRNFEKVVVYCRSYEDLTSLSLVLGFYVTTAIERWWSQFQGLPWPDDLAFLISSAFKTSTPRDRVLKRTFMRYINLTFTLTMSLISPQIKKRFPTLSHMVGSGLMTEEEREVYTSAGDRVKGTKQWIPLMWAVGVLSEAREEGRLTDDYAKQKILDSVTDYRKRCQMLLGYDRNSIPLVFTQVVALAVYCFFLGTLMGRQFILDESPHGQRMMEIDLYVPWFTLLQFFFYVGWLKVAETLIDPFGEDDEDFEINGLLDRHLQMSFMVVEECRQYPKAVKDKYWSEIIPKDLPHTVASKEFKLIKYDGSTANLDISKGGQKIHIPTASGAEGSNRGRKDDVPKTIATLINNMKVQYTQKEPENQQVLLFNERAEGTSTPRRNWPGDTVA